MSQPIRTSNTVHNKISKEHLAELLAKVRAAKSATTINKPAEIETPQEPASPVASSLSQAYGKHGEAITYNKEQQEFITLASKGDSCILIGSAGTGKTTCMMGAITALIQSGRVPVISNNDAHKYLVEGTPGIIATSYTRRAVANLRKAMPAGMEQSCITIHKLLEYQPVPYTVLDPETGIEKNTIRFEPTRNSARPIPSTVKVIIIDEASMVSVDLFKQLISALPHAVQFIFLGDIQQLPPVFGAAILGYKMLELPTVELVQVYRQALESPIIKYATSIRQGEAFSLTDKIVEETTKGKVTFHPWKKKLSSDVALLTFSKFITMAYDHGHYNPENDMILIPFNKAFGTVELNKHIADHIAKKEGRVVWEIVAGFMTLYFSVGDKVLYDKEDATITRIVRNGSYCGKATQTESTTLNYWGQDNVVHEARTQTEEEIDLMLENLSAYSDSEERVRAASHIVTVTLTDTGPEVELDTASELNALLLSYALTVHKAQGSEWDKVFLVLHQSHATMCQRELLYTAVTRAAKELYVICEPDTFKKGVESQRIKGDTLAEKAEYFKGKLELNGGY